MSGNGTRASRVAGENSTTEPTLLVRPISKSESNITFFARSTVVYRIVLNSRDVTLGTEKKSEIIFPTYVKYIRRLI